jgi:lysosomal acid lipase/cholesteryl ester hydrolase
MRVFKEFKKLSLYLQTELIAKYGYESETHKVETPDGYILEMHRMVGKKNQTDKYSASGGKPVVFLMHGLLCSSADWIYMGPEKSLGR